MLQRDTAGEPIVHLYDVFPFLIRYPQSERAQLMGWLDEAGIPWKLWDKGDEECIVVTAHAITMQAVLEQHEVIYQ